MLGDGTPPIPAIITPIPIALLPMKTSMLFGVKTILAGHYYTPRLSIYKQTQLLKLRGGVTDAETK